MSQNASAEFNVIEPEVLSADASQSESHESAASEAGGMVGVESYADRLMDELFEDVDRILDGKALLPSEPVKPEYVSLQPITIPKLSLPSRLLSRGAIAEPVGDVDVDHLTATLDPSKPPKRQWLFGKTFDQLLVIAACASLATAGLIGAFWLWQTRRLATIPVASPAPSDAASGTADQEFLEYMSRALAVLERKADMSRVASTPGTSATLPTVPVPGSTQPNGGATAASSSPTYVPVPVYQPPQNLAFPLPAAQPNAASAPTPAPVAPAPMNPAPETPAEQRTLVGVLELGDRSAALFEVNGVTQRVSIGENIGSSGWNLVSIANQEAMIRRNGEVRSIYVGQQF